MKVYIYVYIYVCVCVCGQTDRQTDKYSARGVRVIVVGKGHSDTSSNPGRDWLHFT